MTVIESTQPETIVVPTGLTLNEEYDYRAVFDPITKRWTLLAF